MKSVEKMIFAFAFCLLAFPICSISQTPDFTGMWTGKAVCPFGPVEFTMEIQGDSGTLIYEGFGPQKLYATKKSVKVGFVQETRQVEFYSPGKWYEDFQRFTGIVMLDGRVVNLNGLNVNLKNGKGCNQLSLVKTKTRTQSEIPKIPASSNAKPGTEYAVPGQFAGFDIKGLTNDGLYLQFLNGSFAKIGLTTDDPAFFGMFDSYLRSYSRACAVNPKMRPKNFVQMTERVCAEETATGTTYARRGVTIWNAPYCSRWKNEPTDDYSDPQMWEINKQLETVYFEDAYKDIFSAMRNSPFQKRDAMQEFEDTMKARRSPIQTAALIAVVQKDMDALLKQNACNSPGLLRFQENLRLFAINRPFGIRTDGSSDAPIPIPAPGTSFRDPSYVALLEDLVVENARTWAVNKLIRDGFSTPSVTSRDSQGRPIKVTVGYRFAGMGGMENGSVTVTFYEGYPECLYFFDKPNICRTPNRQVVSRYLNSDFYSIENVTARREAEIRRAEELKSLGSPAERRRKMEEMRRRPRP